MGVENKILFGDQNENRCSYFVGVSCSKKRLVLTQDDQLECPAGHTKRWDMQLRLYRTVREIDPPAEAAWRGAHIQFPRCLLQYSKADRFSWHERDRIISQTP